MTVSIIIQNFNAKIPASEMKEDTLGVPIEEE